MYLQRQITAIDAEGLLDSSIAAQDQVYRLTDVLPKYILNIGSDAVTSDYIRLNAATSFSVPLPVGYTSADKLSVIFRSNNICKLVIVSPGPVTSTFLLKGTNGSTNGDHLGVIMWQGNITSITVSVPTAFDPALIEYFMFKIPDLTDPDSWQLGYRALGAIPTP